MHVGVYACLSVNHVSLSHGVHKRASGFLELELQTVASHHVGAGN